jgi:hypothetical protein
VAVRGGPRGIAGRPPGHDGRARRTPGLACVAGAGGRLLPCALRPGEWRNWQTRTVQVRVSFWTWGFKSPLAHFTARPVYEAEIRGIDATPLTGVGGVAASVTPC